MPRSRVDWGSEESSKKSSSKSSKGRVETETRAGPSHSASSVQSEKLLSVQKKPKESSIRGSGRQEVQGSKDKHLEKSRSDADMNSADLGHVSDTVKICDGAKKKGNVEVSSDAGAVNVEGAWLAGSPSHEKAHCSDQAELKSGLADTQSVRVRGASGLRALAKTLEASSVDPQDPKFLAAVECSRLAVLEAASALQQGVQLPVSQQIESIVLQPLGEGIDLDYNDSFVEFMEENHDGRKRCRSRSPLKSVYKFGSSHYRKSRDAERDARWEKHSDSAPASGEQRVNNYRDGREHQRDADHSREHHSEAERRSEHYRDAGHYYGAENSTQHYRDADRYSSRDGGNQHDWKQDARFRDRDSHYYGNYRDDQWFYNRRDEPRQREQWTHRQHDSWGQARTWHEDSRGKEKFRSRSRSKSVDKNFGHKFGSRSRSPAREHVHKHRVSKSRFKSKDKEPLDKIS